MQQPHFSKTHSTKLSQESAAFLSPGNSGKPVGFAGLDLRRQRLAHNKLGGINRATWLHHAGQFAENNVSSRV
jgi:hypothetical protein